MQLFGGKFIFKEPNYVRANFDSFMHAFITCFQIITMENWQEILILGYRSDVLTIVVVGYLIMWIFIGNYIFLNLFLAILLDGFTCPNAYQVYNETWDESDEVKYIEEAKYNEMKRYKAELVKRTQKELTFFTRGQNFGYDLTNKPLNNLQNNGKQGIDNKSNESEDEEFDPTNP